MTKIDSLRRVFLPCFTSSTTTNHHTTTGTTTKKRLSTSLRDDVIIINNNNSSTTQQQILTSPNNHKHQDQDQDSDYSSSSPFLQPNSTAPPRSSKTMVIGTIFGHRRGHVWFAVQHDRLKTKPSLLLQLSIPTQTLVQEMRFGLVRLALECHVTNDHHDSDLGSCPLRSVPVWNMFCNGRKLGFAVRKKASENIRLMLKSIQSTTVGAGVIPSFGFDSNVDQASELIYMRASYECIVGGPDSESFHLINPDGCLGQQELSIFLMRSR
ncbi:protein MIZU-KUSSEI 1 [Rutidosis leptorrhynchoides]|uniref:protein MIZU-KUSSEI 1 n=1 Tax=Rutidosis leptorrhynchoides TaxID=125765 RepID=UPI003A99ACB5